MDTPGDITRILQSAMHQDPGATGELLERVYGELRKLAASQMAREPHQTLQPTALVHEAWIKLAGSDNQNWNGRGHFFGAAAESMRRILIDRARKRNRQRHGAGLKRIHLEEVQIATETDDETLLAVEAALEKMELELPDKARLVRLRFYAGCTLPEAAETLGISLATAKRHWSFARAWLLCELKSS